MESIGQPRSVAPARKRVFRRGSSRRRSWRYVFRPSRHDRHLGLRCNGRPLWADKMTGGKIPEARGDDGVGLGTGGDHRLHRRPPEWGIDRPPAGLFRLVPFFTLCRAAICSSARSTPYRTLFLGDDWGRGCVHSLSFYGWLPLYLPELFSNADPRTTGQGLSFNFGRILAAGGALIQGKNRARRKLRRCGVDRDADLRPRPGPHLAGPRNEGEAAAGVSSTPEPVAVASSLQAAFLTSISPLTRAPWQASRSSCSCPRLARTTYPGRRPVRNPLPQSLRAHVFDSPW